MLAKLTTGRGGAGLPDAKIQQQEILSVLPEYGAKLAVEDDRAGDDGGGKAHPQELVPDSGFFSVKWLVSSGFASGSRPMVNDVCVEDSFPRKRPLRVLPNAPHVM